MDTIQLQSDTISAILCKESKEKYFTLYAAIQMRSSLMIWNFSPGVLQKSKKENNEY